RTDLVDAAARLRAFLVDRERRDVELHQVRAGGRIVDDDRGVARTAPGGRQIGEALELPGQPVGDREVEARLVGTVGERIGADAGPGRSDEQRDGGRRAGDGMHAAGYFLRVDAGILQLQHGAAPGLIVACNSSRNETPKNVRSGCVTHREKSPDLVRSIKSWV